MPTSSPTHGCSGVLGNTYHPSDKTGTDGRVHAGLWDGSSVSDDSPPAVLWADGSTSAADPGVAVYWLNGSRIADNYFDFCDEVWPAELNRNR